MKRTRPHKVIESLAATLTENDRHELLRAAADRFLRARGVARRDLPESIAPGLLSAPPRGEFGRLLDAKAPPDFLDRDDGLGWFYLHANVPAERRKRQGVHYTPAGVVDVLLDGLIVGDTAADARLIDPACGSGAFLLRAYPRLVERFAARRGWTRARAAKSVLTERLRGIDIDPTAIEICRLSLAVLACADGCRRVEIPHVRCGDALADENAADPACTIVAGNPPFVEGRGLDAAAIRRLKARFRSAAGKVNLACCFLERSFEMLAPGGRVGLVLPATILHNDRYRAAREVLLEQRVERVLTVRKAPFEGAVFDAALLIARRSPDSGRRGPRSKGMVEVAQVDEVEAAGRVRYRRLSQDLMASLPRKVIFVHVGGDALKLLKRIEAAAARRGGFLMEERFDVRDGLSTGFAPFPERLLGVRDGEAFVSQGGERMTFDPALHRPVIDGGEFCAWSPVRWRGRYVRYDKRLEKDPPPPKGRPFNCQLREAAIFDRPQKVVTRQTADRIVATLDTERFFTRNSVHNTYPRPGHESSVSLAALVAVLNSRLIDAYYRIGSGENGRAFPQVHIARLKRFPIAAGLVQPAGPLEDLALRRLRAARRGNDAQAMELDRRIDDLVIAAYGVSTTDAAAAHRELRPAA